MPAAGLFAIGEPGRAALATPDGPPPAEISPPDVAASSAALPGMRIRAASVRGIQHKAQHTARQDAFAVAQAGGRHAIAVVCDGVGSLDCSDYAAGLVSARLAQHAMSGLPWPAAFKAANAELSKIVAEWEALQWGGMATTAVALTVTRQGGWWIGEAAWVGDSSLWHLRTDGAWSAEVRDTLASWWRSPPDVLTFAAQVGFARKSHIDDRTVVGIWLDGE
jgi:hypothetical protein